jgi:hypothetical protein
MTMGDLCNNAEIFRDVTPWAKNKENQKTGNLNACPALEIDIILDTLDRILTAWGCSMVILSSFLTAILMSFHFFSLAYDCPETTELRKIKITESHMNEHHGTDINGHPRGDTGKWFTSTFTGNFGTNIVWGFQIDNIRADDRKEATEKAHEILKNLNQKGHGYKYWINPSTWICSYLSNSRVSNLTALATTTIPD